MATSGVHPSFSILWRMELGLTEHRESIAQSVTHMVFPNAAICLLALVFLLFCS